ncbi:MAG: ZPR1 zinc finger domain-containing protein [Nanoarchaeota archaeon]|nr:ZPR1 zinc finger domain-containing protein [Nanoarchaeota archaeon]
MDELKGQMCMFCGKKELVLMQDELDIPYFGKVLVFSMNCGNCSFSKSDVESMSIKDPCRITFEIQSKKDLDVRVVKSSTASVKIPGLKIDVRPGPASNGYVSNIEGLLNRFKRVIEQRRDSSDDETERKNAKNLLKRLWKVECGDVPLTIVIEDPTGNSGIISEKAKVERMKGKK